MPNVPKNYRLIIIALIFCVNNLLAQSNIHPNIKTINTLIKQEAIQEANALIKSDIEKLKETKKCSVLVHYIFPLGKIHILNNAFNEAAQKGKLLVDFIENNTLDAETLYLANIEYSKLCLDIGELPKAYKHANKAKAYAQQTKNTLYLIESAYYLADYAMKLGQIDVLEKHVRSADSILRKNPNSEFKITARVYNLFGALMYFTSKQDSAFYYFNKALKHIPKLEQNEENSLYLPAAIKGNMSVIKLNQGQPSEAKPLIQSSIQLSKAFLDKTQHHPLENRVKRNLTIAYNNLNGLYFDLGDFEKSDFITKLALDYTKSNFPENSQEYFMAALTHAEVKTQKREFKTALKYLDIANRTLAKIPGDNFQLKAFLYSEYANVYYMMEAFKEALEFRELSNLNYKKSNPNAFDPNKLYNTMNLAIAYSEIGEKDKAIKTAKSTYNYFYKAKGENDYFTNALMLTLAKVYYNLGMYNESEIWSEKSIKLYNEKASKETIDRLYFEEDKAEIYILNAQSKYQRAQKKDSLFLKQLLPLINNAIKALEEKKITITAFNDINALIENNTKVFNFAKKINLELYHITNNTSYLEKTISLHESALYNRIRARLNTNPNISFSGIPSHISKREKEIKQTLTTKKENLDALVTNTNIWHTFLDTLKTHYPKYYKMRYATIEKPFADIYKHLPKNTTVIRYLFIENNLYGFVLSSDGKKTITKLKTNNLDAYITQVSNNDNNVKATSKSLFALYQQLWKPLENNITTEKIIIIPDRGLFNLSIESITPKPITTFDELSTNSLLSKHIISYNYSLLLLAKDQKTIGYNKDFVAFAPEFNADMKQHYSIAITDSLSIDKTYLNLLPQPFSVDLVKEYSRVFNGDYFINENASKTIFKNEANEHKIIHIGTHAESNNITPELSRLIFAKTNENEDNSLYTYEIYNESLNSNLAILTACETGKPTYQSGEGMISLAHAFNYAGSESILTSLWEIDEKSSSEIIKFFYQNIKKGLPKDKALQQAKLSYINKANGRTLHPQYWAGLVLIGDTTPIHLKSSIDMAWFFIIGMLIIIAAYFILKKRNT